MTLLTLLTTGFAAKSGTREQGLLGVYEAWKPRSAWLCRDYGLGFCANSLALGCDCLVRGFHTPFIISATAKLEAQNWCSAHVTSRVTLHAFGIAPAPTEGAPPVQGHIKYTDAVLNNSKGALLTSCLLKPSSILMSH